MSEQERVFGAGDTAILLSGPMVGEECEVLWGPGQLQTRFGFCYGYRVAIPAMKKLHRPSHGSTGNGYFADVEELGPLPAANTKSAFDPALWVPKDLEKKP